MRITINGGEREVGENASVNQLIELLGLRADRVAVELNRKLLRRSEWEGATLSDGDAIEIVQFVGGGAPGIGCGTAKA